MRRREPKASDRSAQKNTRKFKRAMTGMRALTKSSRSRAPKMSTAKSTASRMASHFILMGMMKNSSTWASGYKAAKARNMDMLT